MWQSNRPIAAHLLDSVSHDAFWNNHQSTLVAIGIGRHVRVGLGTDLVLAGPKSAEADIGSYLERKAKAGPPQNSRASNQLY
jgi:hypothetical protein